MWLKKERKKNSLRRQHKCDYLPHFFKKKVQENVEKISAKGKTVEMVSRSVFARGMSRGEG